MYINILIVQNKLINVSCIIAHGSLVIPYDCLILCNPRCAGGCGDLSEQADQGGSRPESMCELPSAPATSSGLQNSALPTQVKRAIQAYIIVIWKVFKMVCV